MTTPIFDAQELYDISLCVGWTVAMSNGTKPEDRLRREHAMRAMLAFKRHLGDGFYSSLLLEIEADKKTS